MQKGSRFGRKTEKKTGGNPRETRQKSTVIYHGFRKPKKRDPKTPTNFFKLERFALVHRQERSVGSANVNRGVATPPTGKGSEEPHATGMVTAERGGACALVVRRNIAVFPEIDKKKVTDTTMDAPYCTLRSVKSENRTVYFPDLALRCGHVWFSPHE